MTQSFKDQFKAWMSNDFIFTVIIMLGYFLTHGYIYGWDDQHLEIPLLKHLIDPSLYKGDYYVESLARNFSSYLYPLLARCIKVDQVPAAYFILFVISRYFIFFFLYRLWQFLSKDKFTAACGVFMFMCLGRTEELLYRTFSHQIAGECFMFIGIYCFYKERYMLAALIFGLAANIHGIYNLFPMIFMLFFLFLFHPKRWSMVFKTGLTFTLFCMPFLMWQIPRSIHDKLSGPAIPSSKWIPLYFQSCPQNLLFFDKTWQEALSKPSFFLARIEPYIFLTLLYSFLMFVYPPFRKDKKTQVVVITAFALIVFSTFFSYVIPSRFVVDLNLIRNEQFIRTFLMAYTTFWAVKAAKEFKPWQAFLAALIFVAIGFGGFGLFILKLKKYKWVFLAMAATYGVLQFKLFPKLESYLRKALVVIPLLGAFIFYCSYHYEHLKLENEGIGSWQLQRSWEDMQHYVHDHTAKDALILTPVDMNMGGFRIGSERKVVVCTRDCGIIGFDYAASVEWRKRMDDFKDFVVLTNDPVDKIALMAILKYKVDYIVFMNYYAPKVNNPVLKKIYQNEAFSLFQVMMHP